MPSMSQAAEQAGDPTSSSVPDTSSSVPDEPPTSFFAGIGNCIWDELKGLWDLAKFLVELSEDFDLAADGRDNWGARPLRDAADTALHLESLESGARKLSSYTAAHQAALQKIYAKIALIRDKFEEIADDGIDFLAAYDVYIDDTSLRYGMPNMLRALLSSLAEGMMLLYTAEEWAMRAARGRSEALQLVENVKREFESRPWYAAGYALCLIATTLIPISRVTLAIKALRPVLAAIDAAVGPAGISAAMRGRGLNLPEHLGGTRPREVETPVPPPDRIETRDDANPQRAEDPADRETPAPTRNTSEILGGAAGQGHRSRMAGRLAEDKAAAEFQMEIDGLNAALPEGAPQWEVVDMKYGADNGVDLGAILRDGDGQIVNIELREVKSVSGRGSPSYTSNERLGGAGMLLETLKQPVWRNDALRRELLRLRGNGAFPDVSSEIVRYDVDVDAGTIGQARRKPWEAGNSQRFVLDANSAPSTFNSRAELENYINGLGPKARQNAFDSFPALGEEFPHLAPN